MDDIPFDLRALRIILYDKNAPEWGPLLKVKIENALKEVLVAPVEAVLPAFLDVKSAGEKPAVSPERKDLIELKQELDLVRRQLRARSVDMEKSDAPISPSAARFRIRELVRRGAPERIIVDQLGSLGAPASWVLDQIRQFRKMKATRRHPPSSLAKRSKKS